jgi:hypothetical protein
VENVKKPTVESSKKEKPNDALTYLQNPVGGSEDDNTVIEELEVENTVLNAKVTEVEFSQSTTQAGLREFETEPSTLIADEAPDPAVATEAASPT